MLYNIIRNINILRHAKHYRMQGSKASDTNGGRNIMQLNGLNGFALTIYFSSKVSLLT